MPCSTGLSGFGCHRGVPEGRQGSQQGTHRPVENKPAALQTEAGLQAGTLWKRTAHCQLSPAQGTPLCAALPGQGCRRSSDFAAGRGGVKGTAILLMPFTFARVERAY